MRIKVFLTIKLFFGGKPQGMGARPPRLLRGGLDACAALHVVECRTASRRVRTASSSSPAPRAAAPPRPAGDRNWPSPPGRCRPRAGERRDAVCVRSCIPGPRKEEHWSIGPAGASAGASAGAGVTPGSPHCASTGTTGELLEPWTAAATYVTHLRRQKCKIPIAVFF